VKERDGEERGRERKRRREERKDGTCEKDVQKRG
tara:strand:- start:48 stop:149 length:102 start_codon:yes stop_codon:yes gene_type:complete